MNILLIGTGGREHALAWKLAQSPLLSKLFIAAGNGGTAQLGTHSDLNVTDHQQTIQFCRDHDISMVVIGVLIGFFAKPNWYLVWFVLMCLLGAAGIYDFYLWEYDYGHNLDPKAIMSFKNPDGSPMGFQPPLLGTKHILNFVAHSYLSFDLHSNFLVRNEKLNKFEFGPKTNKM